MPKLAQLNLGGATLAGNGCPGQSILAAVRCLGHSSVPSIPGQQKAFGEDAKGVDLVAPLGKAPVMFCLLPAIVDN